MKNIKKIVTEKCKNVLVSLKPFDLLVDKKLILTPRYLVCYVLMDHFDRQFFTKHKGNFNAI